MLKRFFFVLCNLLSAHSWCAETSTESYDSDQESISQPSPEKIISEEELEKDRENCYSVRFQILQNLELAENKDLNYENFTLIKPIVCVGTGRNKEYIKHWLPRPTLLRNHDISIDISSRPNPHWQEDAFCLSENFKVSYVFGAVFFAHVSNQMQALENQGLLHSLVKYYNLLDNNGLFMFESEVYYEKSITELIKIYGFTSLEDLEERWITLLEYIGFSDIKLITIENINGAYLYASKPTSILLTARKIRIIQ